MPSSPTIPPFTVTRQMNAPLDPPPLYAKLREESSISRVSLWEGRLHPWLVTRSDDARTVLGSPAFSSDSSRPGAPTPWKGPPSHHVASSRPRTTPSTPRCDGP